MEERNERQREDRHRVKTGMCTPCADAKVDHCCPVLAMSGQPQRVESNVVWPWISGLDSLTSETDA